MPSRSPLSATRTRRPRPTQADRLEDRAPGQDEVGAVAPDAGVGGALVEAHAHQPAVDRLDGTRPHPGSVHAPAVIAFQAQVDTRDRGHRPGGAQQVHLAARMLVEGAQRGKAIEHVGHFPDHRLEQVRRHVDAAVTVRDGNHADGQRGPADRGIAQPRAAALRAPAQLFEVQDHEFGGAAADVEDHHAARGRVDQRGTSRNGQMGFRLARDDFQRQPGFPVHALEELAAVGRLPTCLGGDQAIAVDIVHHQLVAAHRERLHGRSIACSARRPVSASPCPSRTTREKASTTSNAWRVGRATSRRQLLVPRSSAA